MAMEEYTVRGGAVLRAEGNRLVVGMDRMDGGEDCGGCGSCALKSLCRGRDVGRMELEVAVEPGTPIPAVGERVRVAYRGADPAAASLVMFAPALIGLFAGGFAANLVSEGDAVYLAGAGMGFLLGLAATFAAVRWLPSLRSEAHLRVSETLQNGNTAMDMKIDDYNPIVDPATVDTSVALPDTFYDATRRCFVRWDDDLDDWVEVAQ